MHLQTFNMVKWLLALLFCYFLTINFSLSAAQISNLVSLAPDSQRLSLGKHVYYLEDAQEQLSLTNVSSLSDADWSRSNVGTPNFGYTHSSYWFKLSLFAEGHDQDKIFAIQYALLDYIEFYQIQNGVLTQQYITGDTFEFSERPIRHRDFLFPLRLQANQQSDIYLKVKTQGSLQVPMDIWDKEQFIWYDQDEQFLKAVYYGMMLVLVIYNLFLFLSLRERSYLYYVGLVSSVLLLMTGAHGFLYQYVYPFSPDIHQLSMLLSVPAVMLFAGLFSSYFLSLGKVAPRVNWVVNGFNIIFASSFVLAFFLPYDISTRVSVFLAIPSSLVIMFAGPYAWAKGQVSARYFTYAWGFLITGIVVSASSKFGFIPRNNFTENALSWGSAIEALLLSFALADRFNIERKEKIKAQQAQIEEELQRKSAEEKLYKQATHQSLDGLPNTVLLQQVLYSLMHNKDKCNFTLFYLHLNGIQEISKTLGHANADIVLGLFSKRLLRLKNFTNKAELIEQTEVQSFYFAHIEKGLFAHLIRDTEINTSVEYARELMLILSEPIEYKGMRLDLGVSIGMACYPIHGHDIDTLTRHARVAIDSADNANSHIGVYSADINPYSQRRLVLMGELKKAIDRDSLSLHYQPIINCQSGHVEGVEALIRWNHETLGFIPPDEFIGIAEQTGVMRFLTQWVIARALRDHATRRRTFGSSCISVNISAVNLHEPDFEETVFSLLEQYGVPASELILEVTETSVMKDPDYAISALNSLSEKGIRLAIDDFGTGYSSLTYIQKLPIYELKIDRSFVQNMDKSSGDRVIVNTTLNMARDLGYRIVAEGIETLTVLIKLQQLKCDFAQGYYIAKPMPFNELIRWQQNIEQADFYSELKSS